MSSSEAQWHKVLVTGRFAASRKNPNLCTRCCDALPPGGAYVGNVGTKVVNFTALGDPINVAARDALLPNPDRRAIHLRGGQAPTSVLVAGPW